MPSKRTMLILGAGASLGAAKYPIESSWRKAMAKMPSGENFFHDLLVQEKTETHDKRLFNILGPMLPGLHDLITRAWNLEGKGGQFVPEKWKQLNIEEVCTFLDIGSRMYGRGTQYQKVFELARSSLLSFIAFVLSMKSDGFHCEHLMDILYRMPSIDSIVSFNWDTIVDFTLERTQLPMYKGYLDLMTKEPIRVRDFRNRPLLLKLHGSLNWIICPNPECYLHGKPRLAVKGKKLTRLFRTGQMRRCPHCGNDLGEPFIVPPTSQKMIRRATLLHKLWLIARDKLPKCHRLVFVGYSFPSTDFYSEWLFRQIYFIDGPLPEIFIVNPEAMNKRSLVAQRYDRLFRGCEIHRFATLAEFAGHVPSLVWGDSGRGTSSTQDGG